MHYKFLYSKHLPDQLLSANQQHIQESRYLEQTRGEKIILGKLIRIVLNGEYSRMSENLKEIHDLNLQETNVVLKEKFLRFFLKKTRDDAN